MPKIANVTHSAPLFGAGLAPSLALALLMVGCASTEHRAPVEERKPQVRAAPPVVTLPTVPVRPAAAAATSPTPSAAAADVAAAEKLQLPGWENAGKPGYYTVKPGDTLIRIGLDHGQNWRDVGRWSGLDNPNIIEVGQVLRVVPPNAVLPPAGAVSSTVPGTVPGTTTVATVTAGTAPLPVPAGVGVETRTLDGRVLTPAPGASAAAGGTTGAAAGVATTSKPATSTGAAVEGDEELTWSWPAAGPVQTPFDEVKSKGLGIAGKAGDSVFAAADGRVVYSGSGLRGYGNLIIVKHNNTYLTAYAHNQTLLVKEDQAVRRGQKIAEMGSSDADRVKLHFEVRRQGKPIDPARLLPQR